mmetsp:Transcript_10156/g.17464  ORF Transcript_10156/g.17464 Transcript_10156/m.17464 type:complete len:331 (-) Transcript_10156:94-1086(-)|eukprot:CAMPEP_0198212830 /NCGR_PEP_ID=MMETSP1445-20131203/27849_1 /TAXON_ID=36898 /ORGANISM="Pyramimonas sp., Strain CCMP2087" /LENGTH=330 /DNA_ID=CAMNT_0043887377 /DNA_START=148 /DNA_END=1140 /DNA_ORIENTATION=-
MLLSAGSTAAKSKRECGRTLLYANARLHTTFRAAKNPSSKAFQNRPSSATFGRRRSHTVIASDKSNSEAETITDDIPTESVLTPATTTTDTTASNHTTRADDTTRSTTTSDWSQYTTVDAELWVGRQAMLGFSLGVVTEALSGNTMLQQIGIDVQTAEAHEILVAQLLLAFFGATMVGGGVTISRAKSGKMTTEEFKKYSKFLGANTEETAEIEASMLKEGGLAKLLEAPSTNRAGPALKPKDDLLWTVLRAVAWVILAGDEKKSEEKGKEKKRVAARDVELNAGRLAMVGFASAVFVEAASGIGIMQQLYFYSYLFESVPVESVPGDRY